MKKVLKRHTTGIPKNSIMYLDKYKIEGAVNMDSNPCFHSENTYPNFQEDLEIFKSELINMVENKSCKSFYKFGDGDYFFLKSQPIGSATPGKRALSKNFSEINMENFTVGSKLNDFYLCEIYPENRKMFNELFPNIELNYPAEYVYGLLANKWLLKEFKGKVGLIGAGEKIEMIRELMSFNQYQEYLGADKFNDYIKIPQKFACDDLDTTEKMVAEQLANSDSDIFLVGIGHVKSGLMHRLKKYKNSIFLDVGSGIDALAGVIDTDRPFFGDWTNYQYYGLNYASIDFLAYQGKGKHIILG